MTIGDNGKKIFEENEKIFIPSLVSGIKPSRFGKRAFGIEKSSLEVHKYWGSKLGNGPQNDGFLFATGTFAKTQKSQAWYVDKANKYGLPKLGI